MSSTIKLPSGKLIDLSRFIALLPDNDTTENYYKLSLSGLDKAIDIDSFDAEFISKKLELESEKKTSNVKKQWDREEQLRLNQPKLKKLREKIERMKQEEPSEEKAEFFESFKRTMDAYRPEGRKLYEH